MVTARKPRPEWGPCNRWGGCHTWFLDLGLFGACVSYHPASGRIFRIIVDAGRVAQGACPLIDKHWRDPAAPEKANPIAAKLAAEDELNAIIARGSVLGITPPDYYRPPLNPTLEQVQNWWDDDKRAAAWDAAIAAAAD